MHKRRISHRGINSESLRILVVGCLLLIFLLSIGYSAFVTNISIESRGNVKRMTASKILKKKVVTTGDGLYTDGYVNGRYVYKGGNPYNYICLSDLENGLCPAESVYRIMAIESDGTLKVIKNTSIVNITDLGYSDNVSYTDYLGVTTSITNSDSNGGTRYSSNSSDYCYISDGSLYNGCSLYSGFNDTYKNNGGVLSPTTTMANLNGDLNLPGYDSYINVYLNGGTYPTESSGDIHINGWFDETNTISNNVKSLVDKNHNYNIGPVSHSTQKTFSDDVQQDNGYVWVGNVGLLSVIDYVKANTNTELCGTVYLNTSAANNYTVCRETNWLGSGVSEWTMSPNLNVNYSSAWYINGHGGLGAGTAYRMVGVRPVLHLKASITLVGNGTDDGNIYKILWNE